MIDPRTALISKILAAVLDRLEAGGEEVDRAWTEARQALDATESKDAELDALVTSRDVETLRTLVCEWVSGERSLPEQDRNVLKRAMKAYKKRVKLARLDDESSIGGGSMSGGRKSGIVGVRPPTQYPAEVWDELVRLGRLVRGEAGMVELPPS